MWAVLQLTRDPGLGKSVSRWSFVALIVCSFVPTTGCSDRMKQDPTSGSFDFVCFWSVCCRCECPSFDDCWSFSAQQTYDSTKLFVVVVVVVLVVVQLVRNKTKCTFLSIRKTIPNLFRWIDSIYLVDNIVTIRAVIAYVHWSQRRLVLGGEYDDGDGVTIRNKEREGEKNFWCFWWLWERM